MVAVLAFGRMVCVSLLKKDKIKLCLFTISCFWGCVILCTKANAQFPVDLSRFDQNNSTTVAVKDDNLEVEWITGGSAKGQININLEKGKPLFSSISLKERNTKFKTVATNIDPAFILTVGKRDLKQPTEWIIFFDNPWQRPYKTYRIKLNKKKAKVVSEGSRTHIIISSIVAGPFSGNLEITLFKGTPLMKIEAVLSSSLDSAAIVYDAGLINSRPWDGVHGNKIDPWAEMNINPWAEGILWTDSDDKIHLVKRLSDPLTSRNVAVKYRTIVGQTSEGAIAVFPPPHQYFFAEDNAYNMKYNWFGRNYLNLIPQFGIGVRQKPDGDRRFVPWFNAPPETKQRLSFFCLVSTNSGRQTLQQVAAYTHNDEYVHLPGYHTFATHFHIEPEVDILSGKPISQVKKFVPAFKNLGVDIVHLASFHGPGHPEGPDSLRFLELKTSYDLCRSVSDTGFLLLPGEEPNHFLGGHWIDLFPRPVYWVMSGSKDQPWIETDPKYGKVYHIGNKEDMFNLLKAENGLVWTSHARIKGSVGYPDSYKKEPFYQSDHFLGAAWKNVPTDLSLPILGKRALNLMSDMANWGQKKYMLGEADVFKVLPQYELYGPLNINYLQLDSLPSFDNGWQPVLDALSAGKFFVTTGEILLPEFSINGKGAGETLNLNKTGNVDITLKIEWTFPLNFISVVSGDGKNVYHKKIDMADTKAFGEKRFTLPVNLKNRKWVRVEVWDVAADGAFTQPIWLK